jgi:hypothetical protein
MLDEMTCPECGQGTIEPRTAKGKRFRYRQMADVEIREDVMVPTCTRCGTEWLDGPSTRALDESLERAYRAELQLKAERAIEKLRPHIRQGDLERLLGVSPGWLSKVKSGRDVSAPLVALLSLLAEQPGRVAELRGLWTASHAPGQGPVRAAPRVRVIRAPDAAELFQAASVLPVPTEPRTGGASGAPWKDLAA